MSAFNTTYNYNMPNMNFGQAIGYGLLGSLTGGMGMGGCFGGGFGSPFSMGGSLFSMMGCGGLGNMYGSPASFFGMGCYSDQMAGAQLGFIGVNLVTGLIGKAIEGRGGSSTQSTADKIKTVESDAKEHLDVLNENGKRYSLENNEFKSAKVEDSYQNTIDKAKGKITEKLNELNAKLDGNGDYIDSKKPQKGESGHENESDSDFTARLTKWQEEKAALEAERKILLNKTDTKNELIKALKEAEDAKNARETAIKNAIEALKPLKTKYDELIQNQKTEKAQKQAKSDAKALKVKGKGDDKMAVDNWNETTEVTEELLNGAFREYAKANKDYSKDSSNDNRDVYKKKITEMFNKCNQELKNKFKDKFHLLGLM